MGILIYKKDNPLWSKLLLLFLIVTFFNESICYFLKQKLISTVPAYNIYYYFRFPILGWIYFEGMGKTKAASIILKIFLVLTLVLFALNIAIYSLFRLHTSYLLAGGVFIIFFSLVYFYNMINCDNLMNPFISPFFWVGTGFFLYFLGVLPSLGVLNILTKKNFIIASQQLIMSKSLSIVLYSLISFGFYLQWKQQK